MAASADFGATFGRIAIADGKPAAEPDVLTINGRPAEPWEQDRKRDAVMADRAWAKTDLLGGLCGRPE